MEKKIDFFLMWTESQARRDLASVILNDPLVNHLYIICSENGEEDIEVYERVTLIHTNNVSGTKFLRQIVSKAKAEYIALYLKPNALISSRTPTVSVVPCSLMQASMILPSIFLSAGTVTSRSKYVSGTTPSTISLSLNLRS